MGKICIFNFFYFFLFFILFNDALLITYTKKKTVTVRLQDKLTIYNVCTTCTYTYIFI